MTKHEADLEKDISGHGAGADPAVSPKNAPRLADDHGMPPPLIYLAVVVGLLLVAAGAALLTLKSAPTNVSALMVCVGFGLVLAAFGARAAGTWRSWSLAGSAAITVVLYLLLALNPSKPPPAAAPFVYGHIEGTEAMQDVEVKGQNSFLVGRVAPQGHWQFFAREQWLTGDYFSIRAKPADGVQPNPIYVGCLKLSLLREKLGSADGVDLTLTTDASDASGQQWILVKTGQQEPLGVFGNPNCPVSGKHAIQASSLARAAVDLLVAPAVAAETLPDLKRLFADLNSDSLTIQGAAQDSVARLRGPENIEAVVNKWKEDFWNEKLDTALLVAWVSGIRQTRDVVVPIADALSHDQIEHIVQLTGSRDRTTRYNAAELLSWLLQSTAWPNPPARDKVSSIFNAALEPFSESREGGGDPGHSGIERGNVAFNTLVALQDAKCDLRPADRDRAVSVLSSFEVSQRAQAGMARTLESSRKFRSSACN